MNLTNLHASKGIVMMGEKVVIVRSDKYWSWIGGTLEDGEDPKDALYREFEEEVHVVPFSVRYLGQYRQSDYHTFVYWCRVPVLSMYIGHEIKELAVVNVDELKQYDIYKYWKPVIDLLNPELRKETQIQLLKDYFNKDPVIQHT